MGQAFLQWRCAVVSLLKNGGAVERCGECGVWGGGLGEMRAEGEGQKGDGEERGCACDFVAFRSMYVDLLHPTFTATPVLECRRREDLFQPSSEMMTGRGEPVWCYSRMYQWTFVFVHTCGLIPIQPIHVYSAYDSHLQESKIKRPNSEVQAKFNISLAWQFGCGRFHRQHA